MKRILLITGILITCMAVFAQQESKKITLEDIYKKGTFSQKTVRGLRSMNDGVHYTTVEGGANIVKYSYKTGEKVETFFNIIDHKIGATRIDRYEFNSDESKILITTNSDYIYRRSFEANYFVYDIASNTIAALSENGKQTRASFAPKGNKVVFVRNNNIFIKDFDTNEEKQITTDGKYNHIINGGTDWVYEEEYYFIKAYSWSPEGNKLAYYKFDESDVKVFNMGKYNSELYTENYAFKYPKAGEKNSIVAIHVYDLESDKTTKMDIGEETDIYIPRIKFTKDNNTLAIIRENRLQNKIQILLNDVNNGSSNLIYTETNKWYISRINDDYMTLTEDGKHFIINSEKDGWNHYYLYDMKGNMVNQITKGEWDVTSFIGIDEKKKVLYYQSAEGSPLTRDIYSINLDGTNKKKISEKTGTNTAVFSNGFKYYINYYSNSKTPNYITLHNSKGKLIRVLEDNAKLKETVKKYNFSEIEFLTINTPSSKWDLNAYMIKPKDFDPNKKYPMFMYLYGGPGSQSVRDNWNRSASYFNYLAQLGYIVVCVDNRGTGARGEEFKKMTYGQLGKYETIDQIEAAEYLSSLPYIDENRTGIFGWSYGGFMSTSCLFLGNDVFEMAIAVAPVSSWRYYDSIYTELYMGLPQDNAEGYDNNSPLNHVEKLKGKYLLIHGTADDNVHFQNAIELAEKLVQANKQFDMQFYMDKDHGIYGGNTSLHLRTKMTEFILENL